MRWLDQLSGAKKEISVLNNPFEQKYITEVQLTLGQQMFHHEVWEFKATISFQNGDTRAYQRLEAGNFSELIKKTEAFVRDLGK